LEGLKYIERNAQKMKKVAKILSQEKTTLQKINDWIKLKTNMCADLIPFKIVTHVCRCSHKWRPIVKIH
jgi:calcium-independent phospholipase A2-gamma